MADQGEVDLDSIIDRLLEVRGSRPGKQVQLLETEIRYLCTKAREIFINQPILLELEAPIKVRIRRHLTLLQWGFGGLGCADGAIDRYLRYAETFMDSTTTSSASSNMGASHPKQITSSSATMLIAANNHSKQSASYWRTRSSIPRTSSSCEVTMSAHPSTVSMGFMMNARGGTI